MKIVFTGATGFIGECIYNKLRNLNHEVFILSRRANSTKGWYQVDLFDTTKVDSILEAIGAEVLIHFAWDVTHGVFWTADINAHYVQASKQLFSSFIKHGGKKIIAAGTCAEYPTSKYPVSEDMVYSNELTPYGQAKLAVLNELKELHTEHGTDYVWLRLFGIYGPKENPERFIPNAILKISKQQEFLIKQPNVFVDYIYVEDFADFVIQCIEHDIVGIINIGTGNPISLLDLYTTIKHYIETGKYKLFNTISEADQNSRIPDCSKLSSYMFKPNFQAGLDATINYFTDKLLIKEDI